jgi:hypothetical protein
MLSLFAEKWQCVAPRGPGPRRKHVRGRQPRRAGAAPRELPPARGVARGCANKKRALITLHHLALSIIWHLSLCIIWLRFNLARDLGQPPSPSDKGQMMERDKCQIGCGGPPIGMQNTGPGRKGFAVRTLGQVFRVILGRA